MCPATAAVRCGCSPCRWGWLTVMDSNPSVEVLSRRDTASGVPVDVDPDAGYCPPVPFHDRRPGRISTVAACRVSGHRYDSAAKLSCGAQAERFSQR